VGEQSGRFRFAGGGFGAFVVRPRLAYGGAVEGLPSGQSGRFHEDPGQRGPLRSGAVGQEVLHLVDLGAELVKLSESAESPVNAAGVIDLVAEDLDGFLVEGAGHGEPAP
jgi:hypothetical protein